jgi:hypothetical protein
MLVHNPHVSRLPYNQDPPWSRDRTIWKAWKQGKTPEEINNTVFLSQTEDYHIIGEQMLTQIGAVLENLTSIPWGTEACEALCTPPYRYHTDKSIPNFWWLCTTSDLKRIRSGKEEIVGTTVETIWARNDLHACPIQDVHFGTLATMYGIAEALNLQGADQMAAYKEALQNGEDMPSQEKTISNDLVFFSADGAMAEMIGRMLDTDSNTLDRKHKKLIVNPGAFHWQNDTFRKVNESNEDSVRFIASSWAGKDGRDVTEKNLAYYLYFSDPTIPEKQMSATLAAIIAANAWTSKKVLANTLVGLRKQLFQRKPELLENLKESVWVEVGDSSTSYERRKKTLEHEYYAQRLCPARSQLMFNQRTEFA